VEVKSKCTSRESKNIIQYRDWAAGRTTGFQCKGDVISATARTNFYIRFIKPRGFVLGEWDLSPRCYVRIASWIYQAVHGYALYSKDTGLCRGRFTTAKVWSLLCAVYILLNTSLPDMIRHGGKLLCVFVRTESRTACVDSVSPILKTVIDARGGFTPRKIPGTHFR
jgi:hypothetical protein